jgi:hypothetical protein
MKRSALIFMTTIYLLSIVGMGVNRFYCCGKLASVTLIYGSEDNTGKEAGKKDNCCKNEKQSFKVKDTHVSATSFAFIAPSPAILPAFSNWNLFAVFQERPLTIAYQSNAPPGNPDTPIYTLNCTYRI